MTWWKDLAQIIQAVVTTLAFIVAGYWTYFLYVRKRLKYPRVSVEITVDDMPLTEGDRLLHTEVKIVNKGDVIVTSTWAELRLRQVEPIPDVIRGFAQANQDPVPINQTEIEWPMIAGRKWKFDEADFEVEPGESDSLHADFMVKDDITVVQFYFFLSNAAKSRKNLGWTLTKISKLNTIQEEGRMSNRKTTRKELLTEQQKQQKPQIPQQQQQQKPKEQPKK